MTPRTLASERMMVAAFGEIPFTTMVGAERDGALAVVGGDDVDVDGGTADAVSKFAQKAITPRQSLV